MKTLRNLLCETADEIGMNHDSIPFAVQRYVYVVENRREALAAAEQVLHHARLVTNMRQSSPDIDGAYLNAPAFDKEPSVEQLLEFSLIGTPEELTEKIVAEVRDYGVTHLSVFMQFANMPYDLTLRSLDKFCDQVMPAVNKELEA